MPFKIVPPLYSVWQGMLSRCRNPNFKQWDDYGGRGITVCDRWQTYQNFVADMGPRPPGMTLERKDTNGNYEPGNCVWATRSDQQRNRRVNVTVTIEGSLYKLSELSDLTSIKPDTIKARAARGMSFSDCISEGKRFAREGQWAKAVEANRNRKLAMTHCQKGHEFTPENTSYTPQGWRRCKTCLVERGRMSPDRLLVIDPIVHP